MKIKICVDCKCGVYQWYTSHNDPKPRCKLCATTNYKRLVDEHSWYNPIWAKFQVPIVHVPDA